MFVMSLAFILACGEAPETEKAVDAPATEEKAEEAKSTDAEVVPAADVKLEEKEEVAKEESTEEKVEEKVEESSKEVK